MAIMVTSLQGQRMAGKKSKSKGAEDRNGEPPFFHRPVKNGSKLRYKIRPE